MRTFTPYAMRSRRWTSSASTRSFAAATSSTTAYSRDETLALLRERRVVAIRGNHDRWSIEKASMSSGWDLTADSVAYLESLPTGWRKLVDGVRVVLAHARLTSDMDGIPSDVPDDELEEILDTSEADILIVGHTHAPFVRRLRDGRIVANPGALLRDPAPGVDVLTPGTFAVVDVMARDVTVRRAKDGVEIQLRSRPRDA